LDLSTFVGLRPFLYHLTSKTNFERIRRTGQLQSSAQLLQSANQQHWVRLRRGMHLRVTAEGESILLRDQQPLYSKNILFESGFSFEDLLELLNRSVFFWPGSSIGPIDYGVRHFERYRSENPIILRARLESVLAENPMAQPLFCKFNSGSPRYTGGRASPRGPSTFVPADGFAFTAGSVVEVVFRNSVRLPSDLEAGDSLSGPWERVALG
jgi:hypothetical protein